jgi:Protein of unknown function (DUF3426)
MYARCPHCERLAPISAETLRRTRGQLSCAGCGADYDGLATLQDDLTAPAVLDPSPPLDEIAASLAREARPALEARESTPKPTVLDAELVGIRPNEYPGLEENDEFEIPLETLEPAFVAEPIIPEPRPDVQPPIRTPVWLWVAAVALGLLLMGQIVHPAREPLSRVPGFGPALSALYRRLGHPIEPRFDTASYEVQKVDRGETPAPGKLLLRARIINHGTRPQPFPLLRVTLEDRFGSRIGRRDFLPVEYLASHANPGGPMPPDERADALLEISDPGAAAIGFTLEICVRRESGLVCGADRRTSAPTH